MYSHDGGVIKWDVKHSQFIKNIFFAVPFMDWIFVPVKLTFWHIWIFVLGSLMSGIIKGDCKKRRIYTCKFGYRQAWCKQCTGFKNGVCKANQQWGK